MRKLRMRGFFCKILLLALLLTTVNPAAFKAYAVDYMGSVTLSTDSTVIYAGDEFTVDVSIKIFGFEGITSFTASKVYDESIVQYLGLTVCGNGQKQFDDDKYDDVAKTYGTIMIWNSAGYKNDELIIQMKFKALETTGLEGVDITLKNMIASGMGGVVSYANSSLSDSTLSIKITEPPEPPEVSPFSYKIDYENRRILIERGDNSMFFLSQVDAKGNVKPYEIFEAKTSTIKIDLSGYSAYKEFNFVLYGDVNVTPINLTLTPAIKGLKASYNPLGSSVDERIIVRVGEDELNIGDLQVRTVGSKWEDAEELTEEQLDIYAVNGTTLVFRIKAVEDESPYSSEVKLKIPKRAAGPKLTIDYSKLTVKFPKNSEYRLKHTDVWKTSPEGTVELGALVDITVQNLYIEVRTSETETKPASKFAITAVEAQTAAPTIGEDEESILKIAHVKNGNITASVSIKNTSDVYDIEYAIVASNTNMSSIDLTKQKWKKISKLGEAVLKKSESDGKVIISRYVAVTLKNAAPQFASQISKSEIIIWGK